MIVIWICSKSHNSIWSLWIAWCEKDYRFWSWNSNCSWHMHLNLDRCLLCSFISWRQVWRRVRASALSTPSLWKKEKQHSSITHRLWNVMELLVLSWLLMRKGKLLPAMRRYKNCMNLSCCEYRQVFYCYGTSCSDTPAPSIRSVLPRLWPGLADNALLVFRLACSTKD